MELIHFQVQGCWSRPELTQFTSPDLIQIRTLYLERRYKQCISLCEDVVKPNLHPVHEAFRLFHQACCYEALGLAAHNYSRNKIPFLESAKEKFAAALGELPQPFADDDTGRHDSSNFSPLAAVFNSEIHGKLPGRFPEYSNVPSIQVSSRTRTPSDASSHYSSSGPSSVSDTYTVPEFDRYTPQPDWLLANKSIPLTVTYLDIQKQDENQNNDMDSMLEDKAEATPLKPSYHNRLSTCLSSTHVLSEDLVPSPLFSRTKKVAYITFPTAIDDINMDSHGVHAAPQPPRPLPRTSHTHQTHLSLLPSRRTAVQTLISKFEQTLPSPNTPSSYTTASPPASLFTADATVLTTPVTARFANIASIFTPHAPSPTGELTIPQYLTSHAVARYNSSISAFRTSLDSAISRIENITNEAHEIQEQHFREKQEAAMRDVHATGGAMGQARLRSYWLLSTPDSTSSPHTLRSAQRDKFLAQNDRGLTIDRRRENRAILGSPRYNRTSDPYTTLASATRSTSPHTTHAKTRFISTLPALRAHALEDAVKKSARMAKLRAAGFVVRKEQYGWKGDRHYEEMRRAVEVELGVRFG